MTLEDRLKYCKVCKNRSFDIKSGILCNLTQKKPQFEETCDTYDENEYERRGQNEYLLNERLSSRANRYSTFSMLVSLVGSFLPIEFKIKNRNISLQFIPIFTLALFSFVMFVNLNFAIVYLVLAIVVLGIWLVFVIRKNLTLMQSEDLVIARLDKHGI